MGEPMIDAPYGYDIYTHTEVTPKLPPSSRRLRWRIGPVSTKASQPPPGTPGTPATGNEDIAMQLTADQQVELNVSAQDAYGNEVRLDENVTWTSSDDSIVEVEQRRPGMAIARAVGPVGVAAVTVEQDVVNPQDVTAPRGYQGSIAIAVTAGDVTELTIEAGEPEDKLTVTPQ